jgi:hypothetical protein
MSNKNKGCKNCKHCFKRDPISGYYLTYLYPTEAFCTSNPEEVEMSDYYHGTYTNEVKALCKIKNKDLLCKEFEEIDTDVSDANKRLKDAEYKLIKAHDKLIQHTAKTNKGIMQRLIGMFKREQA